MRKAAMQGSRNHFGQLGRLAVCAMGRSDSARVHGGEHGSAPLLRAAALAFNDLLQMARRSRSVLDLVSRALMGGEVRKLVGGLLAAARIASCL